jgi:hypothetical protein
MKTSDSGSEKDIHLHLERLDTLAWLRLGELRALRPVADGPKVTES